MALNTQVSVANPLKAKTIGLTDSIQVDGNVYTTLLTVLSTQTLKIEDGVFGVSYKEIGGTDPIRIAIYINISGLRIPILYKTLAPDEEGIEIINLKDIILTPITLKTGDTVFIEYVYRQAIGGSGGTGGGNINCTLLINDYQQ